MEKIPYIYFTDNQKRRASEVDLEQFLLRRGEKLLPSGREKRLSSNHSVTVRGNQWYDHAEEKGGGPISFLQKFYGLTYQEAVLHLLNGEQGLTFEPVKQHRQTEKKAFALPPASPTMRRVYAYLFQHRGISREVLDVFVRAKLIYESAELSADGSKEHHNAVFVGNDEHGAARHAHKRGLYTFGEPYKRNVTGCDARYSFHYCGTDDQLCVFEAPVDLLSFITLYPEDWRRHSYVALCGTSDKAMFWMLEQNPALRQVTLCLDNDAAGIKASQKEISQTFSRVLFKPKEWRKGKDLPKVQGLILGSTGPKNKVTALVDGDDVHCLMIGASGVGKTAFFLYPNLEYACASGMSYLALDTKGDLARNYGTIAHNCYGYQVAVIDLRNPTRSDGNNFLALVNQYVDIPEKDPTNIAAKAKAEKYAKILAKTIINPSGEDGNYGQNSFFYDAAEGLLTSVILLLAEFLPPKEIDGAVRERRHIVSVFKLVQDLLEPATGMDKGKSQFQVLMSKLPSEHKARWFAGAALNTSEQAMASVLSTVLSRLNSFLDSELEQVLCFESCITAESFASKKSAVFLILPEEDPSKNFMAGLMIQNLSRELFAVADENGGKLKNRVVLFCDELGTMPPFDILPLFSAGRSRKLTLVPIIQSLAQLEKNYGKEGAEILTDNCQDLRHEVA